MSWLLTFYGRLWGIAMATDGPEKWVLMALLVGIPIALIWMARLVLWFIADGLTGGELSRRDVQRKATRWGTNR